MSNSSGDNSVEESPEQLDQVSNERAEKVSSKLEQRVLETKLEDLKKELEAERGKNTELARNMKYLQADIVNLQRQTDKMLIDVKNQAKSSLVLEIISILEDLDRALAVSPKSDLDSVVSGLKMLQSTIEARLKREDVERIKVKLGSQMDPRIHEAVASRDAMDQPDGSIVSVVSYGYTMGDKVIKPALVEVARNVAETRDQKTPSMSLGKDIASDQ